MPPVPDKVELGPTTVYVLNVNPGTVSAHWAESMANLQTAHVASGGPIRLAGKIAAQSGANISKARNECVARFLAHEDAEWALLVDSDMVFPQDTIVRLLAAAQVAGHEGDRRPVRDGPRGRPDPDPVPARAVRGHEGAARLPRRRHPAGGGDRGGVPDGAPHRVRRDRRGPSGRADAVVP